MGVMSLDSLDFSVEAMGRLTKAVAFVCGAEHPAAVALAKAAQSGADRDVKQARTLFLRLKPGERRAALAMLADI